MSKYFKLFIIILVLIILMLGILGKISSPSPDPHQILLSPSWSHPLGTDDLGRDIFKMIIAGLYKTFAQAISVFFSTGLIGLVLATLSAFEYQKFTDMLIAYMAEIIRAFPGILLILLFLTFGGGITLALISMYWLPFWRDFRVLLYEFFRSPVMESSLSIGHNFLSAARTHGIKSISKMAFGFSISIFSDILGAIIALDFLQLGHSSSVSIGYILYLSLQDKYVAIYGAIPVVLLLLGIYWAIFLTYKEVGAKSEK